MDSHMDHAHHTGMDHGGMDHGMGDRCSMNMLFTWNTNNLCIVFSQWHIRSTAGLLLSLLAVVALGAGYEALRAGIRRYELAVSRRVEAIPSDNVTETTPLAWATGQNQGQVSKRAHVIKSLLYAVQTFYAFMIMLIFMTYNGWVMLSVTVGAFVGYLLFGNTTTAAKETACH